ncbi:MAG: hypothetical protein MK171_03140 [Pirellulales bacterium]|nr:hypothetical protein [Pirellulales bacterium]
MTSAANARHDASTFGVDGTPVSIFCAPKPFEGHIGVIQRNAIESWTRLEPRPQVILVGDEVGTAEVASEMGATRVPEVACNEFGTPQIDDIFRQARRVATGPILAYLNADIMLLDDFPPAIDRIMSAGNDRWLVIGRRTDLDVTERIDFQSSDWQQTLRARARHQGNLAPRVCKDYFIFPSFMYEDMPAFAVGRGNWDNWVVYHAHHIRAPVIEATGSITAIHQNHGYAHLAGSRALVYVTGPEARRNQELAGGRHLVNGSASGWKLTPSGVRRKILASPLLQFVIDLPRFLRLVIDLAGFRKQN